MRADADVNFQSALPINHCTFTAGLASCGALQRETINGGSGQVMKRERVHVFYSGRVQGVGFRFTVKIVAHGFDVTGTVRNLDDGRVEMVAEGERRELDEFLKGIQDSEVGAFIRGEEKTWSEAKNEFRGFEIIR